MTLYEVPLSFLRSSMWAMPMILRPFGKKFPSFGKKSKSGPVFFASYCQIFCTPDGTRTHAPQACSTPTFRCNRAQNVPRPRLSSNARFAPYTGQYPALYSQWEQEKPTGRVEINLRH